MLICIGYIAIKQMENPCILKTRYGPMLGTDGKLPCVTGLPLEELLQNYFGDSQFEITVSYEGGEKATIK